MEPTPSHIADLPQLLYLALAIATALIGAAWYWRRQRLVAPRTMQRNAAPAGKIVYHDAPTVRVVDSQRIGRIRRTVRLTAAEHIDFLEPSAGSGPRFRVTLKAVVVRDGAEMAHIGVEFRGKQLSCGPQVIELGRNDFLIPSASGEEHRCCVLYFREATDSLDFMRIKVRSLESVTASAELDVLQMSERW